ncbi:MAG: response regulator [Candidatus Limnocylindrales bacterium]|nr:response regulator [Candidatus Limnocylindrales bacterium]
MSGNRAPAGMLSFAAELEATFLEELDERLRSMEAALVEIERPTDRAALRAALEAFGRDAHSLKGGAQLVGRDALAQIAHALESHLEQVRSASPDDPVIVDPLFAAVDALDQLRRSGDSAGVDVAGLVARLSDVQMPRPPGGTRPDRSTAATSEVAAIAPTTSTASTELTTATSTTHEDGPPGSVPSLPDPHESTASVPGRSWNSRRAQAATADRAVEQTRSVRVPTERLDALMNRTADLIAARDAAAHRAAALRDTVRKLGPDRHGSAADVERAELTRQLREAADAARVESQRLAVLIEALETDLLGLRMVPLESLFHEFPRMVRDLARASGKDVRLEALGWSTPMDRDLIERLRDPVMHLLRNAVDHGIEPADVRLERGKPTSGTIILEARPRAGGIAIEVRDDGGGIDLARVHDRAAAAGLVDPEAPHSTAHSLGLIFASGLSTASEVTEVSGRGIGLDVVRAQVAGIGGSVEVDSEPGLGTRFVLRLPLTLVSTTVVVVRTGDRRYAVPLAAVERAVPVEPGALTALGDRSALNVPGGSVVLADLEAMVGVPYRSPDGARPAEPAGFRTALVLASATGRAGIVVDAVEAEREVVLKSFGAVLGTPAFLAGAALVDGDFLLLVLDADAVVERALAGRATWGPETVEMRSSQDESSRRQAADRPVRVLVVDDSITTRTLEKNILSAAGFEVTLAVDGLEALRAIRANRPDVVVSDVAMPGLDGIGLTRQLRANDATHDLPIILVTSLDAPEQRDEGLVAGADAYLTKQAFDQQQLLQAIRELVG